MAHPGQARSTVMSDDWQSGQKAISSGTRLPHEAQRAGHKTA
jgi:hypothetical protein